MGGTDEGLFGHGPVKAAGTTQEAEDSDAMIADESREALRRVCTTLNKHNVDYMVVGGAAVNYYGYSRPSGVTRNNPDLKVDLDFWYNPVVSNFVRLVGALKEMGVDTSGLEELVFDPDRTFLRVPHAEFETDFLPVMSGVGSYSECKQRAERVSMDDTEILVLSYDDLVANKKAINREIDRSDIEELDKLRKPRQQG